MPQTPSTALRASKKTFSQPGQEQNYFVLLCEVPAKQLQARYVMTRSCKVCHLSVLKDPNSKEFVILISEPAKRQRGRKEDVICGMPGSYGTIPHAHREKELGAGRRPMQRRNTEALFGVLAVSCACALSLSVWRLGRGSIALEEFPDPSIADGLFVANKSNHVFKDPRSGVRHSWSNNYIGQTTPIKNWNPLGEDVLRCESCLLDSSHFSFLDMDAFLGAAECFLKRRSS